MGIHPIGRQNSRIRRSDSNSILHRRTGAFVPSSKGRPEKGLLGQLSLGDESVPENRIGLDGKWDIGIGLWFETAVTQKKVPVLPYNYSQLLNVGADYTFSWGNGLYASAEHFIMETSETLLGNGEGYAFSMLSLNYPLGLLDSIMGMIYYDWNNHDWYRFVNFQKMLDQWSLYIIGFWNPDQFQIYMNQTDTNLFAGKGFQVMLVFNH
jgi:hypothetical protein